MDDERTFRSIVSFLFEMGHLKRLPRSGWFRIGVEKPESIAEHSFRTALIGFLIAECEGEDPARVALYCLFHDVAEARTLDLDWLAQSYVEAKDYTDEKVLQSQIEKLSPSIRNEFDKILKITSDDNKIELIARDADLLEAALQAAEYFESGYKMAREWIVSSVEPLQTLTAKSIGKIILDHLQEGELEQLFHWWKGLSDYPSFK